MNFDVAIVSNYEELVMEALPRSVGGKKIKYSRSKKPKHKKPKSIKHKHKKYTQKKKHRNPISLLKKINY
jgi:hypothetical protein